MNLSLVDELPTASSNLNHALKLNIKKGFESAVGGSNSLNSSQEGFENVIQIYYILFLVFHKPYVILGLS